MVQSHIHIKNFLRLIIVFSMLVATPYSTQAEPSQISEANNQLAFDLYKANSEGKGNLFFSPISISTALAMTAAGAANQTLEQMLMVLHLPKNAQGGYQQLLGELNSKKDYELLMANKLWASANKKYYPNFLNTLKDYYSAELEPLDFKTQPEPSRLIINKWVESKTNNLIKDLLPPGIITENTDLILTNAIYFKGKWASEFKKSDTKSDDFIIQADKKIKTPFMHQTSSFVYAENNDCQMLSLPYKGKELRMIVLLPKEHMPLSKFEEVLSFNEFQKITQGAYSRKVIVSLPKFKAESTFKLSENLKSMGMPLAFDANKADFRGIRKLDPNENLYISEVIHKAYADVNEEGTEAAAATAVIMVRTASVEEEAPPVVFNANRPFIFLIKHQKTNAILFMGRYSKP